MLPDHLIWLYLLYINIKGVHDRDRIAERFKVTQLKTTEDIATWNNGGIEIAVAHPALCRTWSEPPSGGSTIIWFGLTWSLELYQQANARLWRQGQKNTVVIHHIITKGTIDERIMQALERKQIGQSALIDAVKARVEGAKT